MLAASLMVNSLILCKHDFRLSFTKILFPAIPPEIHFLAGFQCVILYPAGGQGIWPAFWLLPSEGPEDISGEGVYGHWPMSGEIDVMEAINDMTITHSALHFGGAGERHRQFANQTDEHGGWRVDQVGVLLLDCADKKCLHP